LDDFGFVYTGTFTSGIYKFNAQTGDLVWHVDVGHEVDGLAGITLFNNNNDLAWVSWHGISSISGTTGDTLWIQEPDAGTEGAYAAPVLGNNGRLYSQFNNTIEARNPTTGDLYWAVPHEQVYRAQHTVNADNDVFISCPDNEEYDEDYVLRLNGVTGAVMWLASIKDSYNAVTNNNLGIVYIDDHYGCGIYALRQSDGHVLWTYDCPAASNENMVTLPLVGPGDTLYFGSDRVSVYALAGDTGSTKWTSGEEEFTSSDTYRNQLAANSESLFLGGVDLLMSAYDTVNYDTFAPTSVPSGEPTRVVPEFTTGPTTLESHCDDSPCPTSCAIDGATYWTHGGYDCKVYCIDQPVNGQCKPGGSGCDSSCDRAALILGLVIGGAVLAICGCVGGIYACYKCGCCNDSPCVKGSSSSAEEVKVAKEDANRNPMQSQSV
jgi:outer membrane protein assembly factor BamB